MTRYKALLQERADLVAEGRALIAVAEQAQRDLTDEERTRDDEINVRLEKVSQDIGREERRREWERTVEATPISAQPSWGSAPAEPKARPEAFKTFGEQLTAVARASMPGGSIDNRLASIKAASGLNESIGSEGGFLVQQDFATDLFSQAFGQSEILSRCAPMPITTNANGTKIVMIDETDRSTTRWGGVLAYWAAEAGTVTASMPKFREVVLDLKKLFGLAYATDENLQDAAQLEAVVSASFGEEMIFKTEDAVIEGTGAGQPLGILNAGCTVSVAKETGQAAATIVYENIIKMWARVHPRFRRSAVWLINPDVGPQLDQLAMAVGIGGLPPNYIAYSPEGVLRIKGKPVIEVEYCSTLGSVGDIILADFGQYYLAQKGGVQAAQSIHVKFINDEMTFRFIWRVDGRPKFASAFTPLKGSNTLSSFVTLAVRA